MGNSAMDICTDASYHAAGTYLSHRRGVHIIPKYVFGKPYDEIAGNEKIPSWVRWPVARLLMRAATGPMSRYGLQEPDHKFAQAHPTMSSHRKAVAKRYVASKRHTIQVDFDDYMRVLRRERDAGAQRITTAQAASHRVAA